MIIFTLSECLSSSFSQTFLSHVYLPFPPFPFSLLSVLYLDSSTSHLPLSSYLPPFFFAFMSPCSAPSPSLQSVLVLWIHSPPPFLFSWCIRHNQPLVSGLAWLWCSATCFFSSFSRCLGFVPSASNRLFRVWDRLFLTLPLSRCHRIIPVKEAGLPGLTSASDFCCACLRACVCQLVCTSLFLVIVSFFLYPWSSVITLRQSYNTL